MNWLRQLAVLLIVAVALLAPLSARACPLCADAIANSNAANSEDEIDQFPEAMNQSIYLMLAVPYSAFGVVGFMIYWGVRKNDEYRRLVAQSDAPV